VRNVRSDLVRGSGKLGDEEREISEGRAGLATEDPPESISTEAGHIADRFDKRGDVQAPVPETLPNHSSQNVLHHRATVPMVTRIDAISRHRQPGCVPKRFFLRDHASRLERHPLPVHLSPHSFIDSFRHSNPHFRMYRGSSLHAEFLRTSAPGSRRAAHTAGMESTLTPTYLNRITRWDDTTEAQKHATVLAEYLGSYRMPNPPRELKRALAKSSYAALTAEALNAVSKKKLPVPAEPETEAFVRDAVTIAAPHTAYAADLLLTDTARYVDWCVREKGWPLDAQIIWSVRAIDLYSTTANQTRSEGTRRNYRARLMRISEVLLPHEHPEKQTPLSHRSTQAPYSEKEMKRFRDWATNQLTPEKCDRAMVMLVLCAGAAIRPSEIPLIHPGDVTVDDEGILIAVGGEEPREVPLLAEWEEWMIALLERRPADESLWGPVSNHTLHNLTSKFTERSHGNPPRADRLRHTWIVHHLSAATPMKELFRAAGVTKMQHLHLFLEFVEGLDETDYRRVLRSEGQA